MAFTTTSKCPKTIFRKLDINDPTPVIEGCYVVMYFPVGDDMYMSRTYTRRAFTFNELTWMARGLALHCFKAEKKNIGGDFDPVTRANSILITGFHIKGKKVYVATYEHEPVDVYLRDVEASRYTVDYKFSSV